MASLTYRDPARVLDGSLAPYFDQPLFSDITILGHDGRRLRCHKLVLSAGSSCLHRILENGLLQQPELSVVGVHPKALEAVLRFLYTGECSLELTSAVALWDAAKRLEVGRLSGACSEFVAKELQPSTVCCLLGQAQSYKLDDLLGQCLRYCERWFDAVALSESFSTAPLEVLSAILSHCRAAVAPEKLFRAAWMWAVCDLAHLRELQEVAKLVVLPPHLSLEQLLQMRPVLPPHQATYERILKSEQCAFHLKAIVLKVWPSLASRGTGHTGDSFNSSGRPTTLLQTRAPNEPPMRRPLDADPPGRQYMSGSGSAGGTRSSTAGGTRGSGGGSSGENAKWQDASESFQAGLDVLAKYAYGMYSVDRGGGDGALQQQQQPNDGTLLQPLSSQLLRHDGQTDSSSRPVASPREPTSPLPLARQESFETRPSSWGRFGGGQQRNNMLQQQQQQQRQQDEEGQLARLLAARLVEAHWKGQQQQLQQHQQQFNERFTPSSSSGRGRRQSLERFPSDRFTSLTSYSNNSTQQQQQQQLASGYGAGDSAAGSGVLQRHLSMGSGGSGQMRGLHDLGEGGGGGAADVFNTPRKWRLSTNSAVDVPAATTTAIAATANSDAPTDQQWIKALQAQIFEQKMLEATRDTSKRQCFEQQPQQQQQRQPQLQLLKEAPVSAGRGWKRSFMMQDPEPQEYQRLSATANPPPSMRPLLPPPPPTHTAAAGDLVKRCSNSLEAATTLVTPAQWSPPHGQRTASDGNGCTSRVAEGQHQTLPHTSAPNGGPSPPYTIAAASPATATIAPEDAARAPAAAMMAAMMMMATSNPAATPTMTPRSRKRSSTSGQQQAAVPVCQLEGCHTELTGLREYYQCHKVCEWHFKVDSVVKDGIEQRFCQQCGHFQSLADFDGSKRNCRERLCMLKERRRKRSDPSLAVQAAMLQHQQQLQRAALATATGTTVPPPCQHDGGAHSSKASGSPGGSRGDGKEVKEGLGSRMSEVGPAAAAAAGGDDDDDGRGDVGAGDGGGTLPEEGSEEELPSGLHLLANLASQDGSGSETDHGLGGRDASRSPHVVASRPAGMAPPRTKVATDAPAGRGNTLLPQSSCTS